MKKNKKISFEKKFAKRTTFGRLFAKAMCIVLLCTVVFADVTFEKGRRNVYDQIREKMITDSKDIISAINKNENEGNAVNNNISGFMSIYTNFHAYSDYNLFSSMGALDTFYQVGTNLDEECSAISALIDKDGNIIASSREKLTMLLNFGKGDINYYVCDPAEIDIPEVQELYDSFYQIKNSLEKRKEVVNINLKSVYYNKEKNSFIPHEGEIVKSYVSFHEIADEKLKDIYIDTDIDGYELIELKDSQSKEYPKGFLCNIHGTPAGTFDKNSGSFRYKSTSSSGSTRMFGNAGYECSMSQPVYINGETLTLCMLYSVSTLKGTAVEKHFLIFTLLFFLFAFIIALIWSLWKNSSNKMRYAFEDYQRNLTNNLAHDIKTPLTAISGYAENLLDMCEPDTVQYKYLSSIIQNVAYTDGMISKTLELNQLSQKKSLQKSEVNLRNIAEKALEIYSLDSDVAEVKIEGDSVIKANPETIQTAVENIIANALKYVTKGGEIIVTINKDYFSVENTISEKIDVTDLKMPFVRGDKSRSDRKGNGLGLAIANDSVLINGFTLELSSTDTLFRARINFKK